VTFGGGIGGVIGPERGGGFTGSISASYFSHIGLISVRVLGCGNPSAHLAIPSTDRIDEFFEISGMYGTGYNDLYFSAFASAGLGMVKFKSSYYNITIHHKTETVPSIPIELQAFVTPLPVLGFGITLFGNINGKSPYIGGLLCIRIGKLWPTN
jgi:hypothetical protein